MKQIFITILLWTLAWSTNNPVYLSFDDLADEEKLSGLQDSPVRMRGFLHDGGANNWVLASQPDVKTCCLGKKESIQHIVVHGDLANISRELAINLEGILTAHPNSYVIMKAVVVQDKYVLSPFLIGFVIMLGLVTVYVIWRCNSHDDAREP